MNVAVTDDQLIELRREVDLQADLMIRVATGKQPINPVDQEFQDRRRRIRTLTDKLGLEDPNPYPSLWTWHGKWKSDLPTYQDRREHVTGLYLPIHEAIDHLERMPDKKTVLALQRVIGATFDQQEWSKLAYITNTEEIIYGHPRLLRSLSFGDNDYDDCMRDVIEDLLTKGHEDEVKRFVKLDEWLLKSDPDLYIDLYGDPLTGLKELEDIGKISNIPELLRHVNRIRGSIHSDPELAIGSSKELLETVLKTILEEHGSRSSDDIPKLVRRVRQKLDLENDEGNQARRQLLSGLSQLAHGIAEMRNTFGTGHGRSRSPSTDIAHARLAVDAASALAVFLLELSANDLSVETSADNGTHP